MNITEALEIACKEPTLIDALSWICVWESERAIKQAKEGLVDADGKGWDTCFKFCIERVYEKYDISKNVNILSNEELQKIVVNAHIDGQETARVPKKMLATMYYERKFLQSMRCKCGGMSVEHNIEDPDCFREKVLVNPIPVQNTNDRWIVDGHEITGTTLREQRGYHEHPCGNWSRPKDHESENSIKG